MTRELSEDLPEQKLRLDDSDAAPQDHSADELLPCPRDPDSPDEAAPQELDDSKLSEIGLAYATRLLKHWPKLRAHLQAEDVLQEGLQRLYKSRLQSSAPGVRVSVLKKSIYSAAADLNRKLARQPELALVSEAEGFPQAQASEPSTEARLRLTQVLQELTELLRQQLPVKARSNGVDYGAVLLLQLRLRLAMLFGKALDRSELPQDLSLQVAELLPWTLQQAQRSFKANWPGLDEIWIQLQGDLQIWPHHLTAAQLSTALAGLGFALSEDLWAKWLERAIETLRPELDSSWDKLVQPLLGRSSS